MSQAVLPDTARRTTPAWLAWAGLGVVYVVWGSTYLAIRFTVESMPPLLSGGFRFVIAGLVLLLAVLMLAALGWSVGSVASTRLPVPANPFTLSAVEMVAGGTAMLILGLATGERIDLGAVTTKSWLGWAYLILFGALLAFSSYVFILG